MVYIVAGQLHSRANQRAPFWCHLGSQWERSIIITQIINEARLDPFSMDFYTRDTMHGRLDCRDHLVYQCDLRHCSTKCVLLSKSKLVSLWLPNNKEISLFFDSLEKSKKFQIKIFISYVFAFCADYAKQWSKSCSKYELALF